MENNVSLVRERIKSKKPGLHSKFLELYEVELNEDFSDKKSISVNSAHENDESLVLVEEIKTAIYQLIFLSDQFPNLDIPDYISKKVTRDFIYLNQVFWDSAGISIKKYINKQKIELVKEMLIYDELELSQIVSKLQYRNVAHLVNEFIKETGVSPVFYRLLRNTSSGKSQNVRIV